MSKEQRQLQKQRQQEQLQRIESMKAEVGERELRARFAKANHDIMFYSLESEKLQPAYKEYVERERVKEEEARKQYEEFMKKIAENTKDTSISSEGVEHTITEEDLVNNPELASEVEVGDEVILGPETNEKGE